MAQNLLNALLITAVGMVLVFLALLVLWGLMEVTVQVTAWYNKRHPEEEDEEEEAEEALAVETHPDQNIGAGDIASLPPVASSLKQQAAASAVAVALALRNDAPAAIEPQAGGYVGQPSAWKSVMRSAQLTQRSTQFTRKSRGNVR
jgi:Na+-transporting methylmalonyl-CoA/oxaloacetate decarboxylase gamma subunit